MVLDTAATRDAPIDRDVVVRANTRLSADYHVLALDAPDIAARTRPGQFVMLKPGRGLDPLLRRPFSVFQILRNPDGTPTGVTILGKIVGRGTGLLYALEPGDRLACLGPLGRPFTPPPVDRDVWFIAGGVGLAPFATLAEASLAAGLRPTLFYGARRAADLHFADWFAERGVQVRVSTEDGSAGVRGFVTTPVGQALADAGSDPRTLRVRTGSGLKQVEIGPGPVTVSSGPAIYACGPTPMMRAVAELAGRHGHDVEVSLEQTMGCGMGGCYSCVVPILQPGRPSHFVRSCLAGPTFRASTLAWEGLAH
jgi:dihydroorotate dehydrogenase electron transfer subunit